MSLLTDGDLEMLPRALRQHGEFHIATQWYLRGWEPIWYQYMFHQSMIPNTTFIAGIATGKTTSVAASYMMDCITTPFFRCLNTSVTAKQAELPFEMVMPWIEGNPRLEHLIDDIVLRPYPTIRFKNYAEWIFRTAGKDGRFIRGQEFDRINYDEAGLDVVGETVKVLRGRLRGVRPDGTQRMNRLDMTTSPTATAWLKERFLKGWKQNPEASLNDFFSMRIATYDNIRLTPNTIRLMEEEYSNDMIDVELRGFFPDYGMSMFPSVHVEACTDQSLNDAVELGLRPESGKPKPGYRMEEHPRYGVTLFELPADPKGVYVMGGDPGTDGPPRRNAPVVAVLDVSKQPNQIVYFHWIDGRGAYTPFLLSYKYAINKYRPVLKGVDTTGTQKAIDELAFENNGISVDGINFGRDKNAMINSLITAVADHSISWPVIRGIQRQMGSYTRETDNKVPQDIVMALAEVAFLSRYIPQQEEEQNVNAERANFRNRDIRTNRRRRR
jgi:hypothetical protein